MYVKHCKLTRYQQYELLKFFCAGTAARTASDLARVHRNSGIRFYHKLRCAIATTQHNRAAQLCGSIEVDESWALSIPKCEKRLFPMHTGKDNFANGTEKPSHSPLA